MTALRKGGPDLALGDGRGQVTLAAAQDGAKTAELIDGLGRIHQGRFDAKAGAPLVLDREEALGYLGYAGQSVDVALQSRFDRLADACEQGTAPAFAWAAFSVDEDKTLWDAQGAQSGGAASDGLPPSAPPSQGARSRPPAEGGSQPQVALAGCGLVLPGRDIARHLRGAKAVALMACTLGMVNERELRKHNAMSPTDGMMYGAASSALVEAAANAVEASIVAWAADRGLHTNWRYSPGYGDLPLSVQPAFLRSLDATRRIGLSLTPSWLLVPTKSVTAVVGLFDRPQAGAEVRTGCKGCQLRTACQLRKRGRTCHHG